MTKILFVHNTVMWYRRPFFKKLSEIYDVKFIFTDIQVCKDIYGVEISTKIEGLEGVNYKALKNYFGIPFRLIKELLRGNYDVIIGSLELNIEILFCILISKLKRKPLIIWNEAWSWKGESLKRKLILLFSKFIVSSSDAFLVPGSKHKEYIISFGASPDKVFIMPNVSNLIINGEDYENKEKLKEELKIGDRKVVLSVGRLVELKGIQYLIPSFAKLRKEKSNVILVLVGDGEYKGVLHLLCKEFNIENDVRFIGWLDNKNLAPYYLLCNLFIIPSINLHGRADACPLAVNEAMYFGKPVIATDAVGAAFDMIKHGENGFMVPEKDGFALYEAMKKILSDPELEKRMGEESKRIIEEGFRYEHMVERFKDAIKYVSKNGVKK